MYLKTVVSLSIFIFVLGSTLLNASESSIQTQLPIASTDDNLIDMNEYSKYLSARVEKKGGGRGFYKPRLIEDRSGGRRFYNLQHPFKRSSDEDISGANDLIYYDQQEKRGGGRSFLPPYNTLMYPNEKRIYDSYPYVYYDQMKRGGGRLFRKYDGNGDNKYAYYYGL